MKEIIPFQRAIKNNKGNASRLSNLHWVPRPQASAEEPAPSQCQPTPGEPEEITQLLAGNDNVRKELPPLKHF